MFKRFLITTASAALLAGATLGASAPAQAQVGIEIGPRGPRVYDGPREEYRPVIERRERRVIVDDEEECEMVTQRRVNRFGETVVTRKRVCN